MNKETIIQTILELFSKTESLQKENIELRDKVAQLEDKVKRMTAADKTKKKAIWELQTKLQDKEREMNLLMTYKKINDIKSKNHPKPN